MGSSSGFASELDRSVPRVAFLSANLRIRIDGLYVSFLVLIFLNIQLLRFFREKCRMERLQESESR